MPNGLFAKLQLQHNSLATAKPEMSGYNHLPLEPPPYVPDSDDESAPLRSGTDTGTGTSTETARPFEPFEIEEPLANGSGSRAGGLRDATINSTQEVFNRAGEAGQRFADTFSSKVVMPITNALDPLCAAYRALHVRFDQLVGKIGNPLIVKRLFYVIVVASVVYVVTLSGLYPESAGSYNGDFFDQQQLQQFVDDNVDVKRMEENLQYFSSMPHVAGTAGDLTLARYFERIMKDAGVSVEEFSEFSSYAEYGANQSLKLYKGNDVVFESPLIEQTDEKKAQKEVKRAEKTEQTESISGTAQKAQTTDADPLLSFNPGSCSGTSTGHLVYANYGTRDDFKFLVESQVDLTGSVVMMKYHGADSATGESIQEGMKVNIARGLGAIAVLFISDPRNGAYTMDTVERHGMDISRVRPGNSAGQDMEDSMERLDSLPEIPAVPISWREAVPLLKTLESLGIQAPDSWKLNFAGEPWTGSKDTEYSVEVTLDPAKRPQKAMWNVIGKIKGREQDELAVVIGAQRDAVSEGTIYPNTGSTILVELIALFAELQHAFNWKPLRSIYFASFDGTEYNLAGSTNLASQKVHTLRREAYAYIDLSDAVSGTSKLGVSAHPMLWSTIRKSLRLVQDPVHNRTLDGAVEGMETLRDASKNYIPFMSYLGVPSMELRFYGDDYAKGSAQDSFEAFKSKNVDEGMEAHKALSAALAKIVLALVEEPMIPFDIVEFAKAMDHYLRDLGDYAEAKKMKLDTSGVLKELLRLKDAGRQYDSWLQAWQEIVTSSGGTEPTLLSVNRWTWNSKLSQIEKSMLADPGVRGREWYKNHAFGPQLWGPDGLRSDGSAYEWGTFPGVRDAIFEGDEELARVQLDHVRQLFDILTRGFGT
ncbi:unnamed protein product [Kuraishia capsulata CBS 1993]|uniref:Uncharacterized protein n=1 Tax=Kuraishia capsulata CBS 1993 TaxID=1382522 RepID=W6MSH6_9ASCO|nr:uncharacterized protein KUCA_T00000711001 [Kuraishia capsulata CBS 1993]CDK24745.1 unnamed protein product [Kuraishia capsulata CBS 1993]